MAMQDLLHRLQQLDIPKTKRIAISPQSCHTMTLGVVHVRFTNYYDLTCATKKNQDFYHYLIDFVKAINPNFIWTTCTINKNVITNWHFDKKNFGKTLIFAVGDYTGGRLLLRHGDPIDIKEKPFYFNGHELEHSTEPFTGTRYSLMFYNYRWKPHLRPNVPTDYANYKEMKKSVYENKNIGFLIEPTDHWIDIGAYIGLFAQLVAMNGASCVSYEPHPESFQVAQLNAKQVHNYAVGVKAGVFDLFVSPTSPWMSSMVRPIRGRTSIPVETVPFAEVVKSGDCVKMDIEGAELDLLDQCDFTGLRKLVIAYHINYDPSRDNLLRRLDRLKTFFTFVHCKVPPHSIMKFFPNEILIWCLND